MVPKSKDFLKPVFELFKDGDFHSLREAERSMWDCFKLSASDKEELTEQEYQRRVYNRTQWAINDLCHAGMLSMTDRGVYTITHRGRNHLDAGWDVDYDTLLTKYEEFRRFKNNYWVLAEQQVTEVKCPIEIEIESTVQRATSPHKIVLLATVMQRILPQMDGGERLQPGNHRTILVGHPGLGRYNHRPRRRLPCQDI